MTEAFNQNYNLPQSFFKFIEPYIRADDQQVITEKGILLGLWRRALVAKNTFPEAKEPIAEWTMSAAAGSPLLENQAYDEIHVTFGSLEDIGQGEPEETVAARWEKLAQLVEAAE